MLSRYSLQQGARLSATAVSRAKRRIGAGYPAVSGLWLVVLSDTVVRVEVL